MKDRQDELTEGVAAVVNGESHADVVGALSTLLCQAIADELPTVEQAEKYAVALGVAMAADIRKNWHLVTARRKAQ